MKLLWTAFLGSLLTASAEVDERSVLLEFFQATGGSAWNNHTGWMEQAEDVCTWFGVLCEAVDENDNPVVSGLELEDNFLVGRTPDSLWTLPKLDYVALSFNSDLEVSLTNIVPGVSAIFMHETATTSLAGVAQAAESLERLHAGGLRLQSAFPQELLELSNLMYLHMAQCGLTGPLPANMTSFSLRELDLFDNDLSGAIPDIQVSRMRKLVLSHNRLTGTIPDDVEWMMLLEELHLDDNLFWGPIPTLLRMPRLSDVFLQNNLFSGAIPSDFLRRIPEEDHDLVKVDLSHNRLSGIVPGSLDILEDVPMDWDLSDNQFVYANDLLCDNEAWGVYGCDYLMCPTGTFHPEGHATEEQSCRPCSLNVYAGLRTCWNGNDAGVLRELYYATGGDEWINNDMWLTQNHCEWHGVLCWDLGDARDGRVREINLAYNGLKGTIPESIWAMHYLVRLKVSRNDVVVPMVTMEWARYLHTLQVSQTMTRNFDGIEEAPSTLAVIEADRLPLRTMPAQLLALTSLHRLSLADCGITGELYEEDWQGMTELEELYLYGNALQGTLPTFNSMSKLRILSLAGNRFTGTLPTEWQSLTSLQALSLKDQTSKGGGLSGPLLPLDTHPHLHQLHLSHNQLEGAIPASFLNASNAATVDASHNVLSGVIPASLASLSNLNLHLENNAISGVDPALCAMGQWQNGAVQEFGCNAILCPRGTMGGRQTYADVGCLPCKSNNYLGQIQCGTQTSLSERAILERLYNDCNGPNWKNSQNWLSDEHDICDWHGVDCDETQSVVGISLGDNGLRGAVPTEIYQLNRLNRLALFRNDISVSFAGVEHATQLSSLSLDQTGLKSLAGIGEARALRSLNIASNGMSGPIPMELERLFRLETLVMSNNAFTGTIPTWLYNPQAGLVHLRTWLASYNALSGPLPDLARLSNMIMLDISHNELTGTIPPTFLANAIPYEKLVADLAGNKLTGTLPGSLARLERLSIRLSGNLIVGIDDSLCEVNGWNDFDVQAYGCDAIMCPILTANPVGRQVSADMPCVPCPEAAYMGSTLCGSFPRAISFDSGAMSLWTLTTAFVIAMVTCLWNL